MHTGTIRNEINKTKSRIVMTPYDAEYPATLIDDLNFNLDTLPLPVASNERD